LKPDESKLAKNLVKRLESVSEEIQLLALNIAVAAAKMAQKKDPGLEVHHKLSNLVNQATQAVKQMNKIVKAAKTENMPANDYAESEGIHGDPDFIYNIEFSLKSIISDSERIAKLLHGLKKG